MTKEDITASIIEEIMEANRNNDNGKLKCLQSIYSRSKFDTYENLIKYLKENKNVEYLSNLCAKYLPKDKDYYKDIFENDIKDKNINNTILSSTINYYISEYPQLDEEYIKEKIREKVYEKTQ